MKIETSRHAYLFLKKYMIHDVEELWCLALGPGLHLIDFKMIFRGTVDECTVHPRDIFRFALQSNASQLLVAHNHPSGSLQPSDQDLIFTKKIIYVGWQIEIPVIDHLILTSKNYLSIAEKKFISFSSEKYSY